MAADPVVLTVACTCRLGSHTLAVPASTLVDGGTITAYCTATGKLYYATTTTTTTSKGDE